MNKTTKISELPQPPSGSSFGLVEVKSVSMPHPYCITPKHVAYAADHCGGMLGTDAIRAAEKTGAACCDICLKSGNGILGIDKHTTSLMLLIRVPQNKDLNAVVGLHDYLFGNKAAFEKMGIEGFAFLK
jgi:hypothetical protein